MSKRYYLEDVIPADNTRPVARFGILDFIFGSKNGKASDVSYRGRPGVIVHQNGKEIIIPKRTQHNTSPTKNYSQAFENRMAIALGVGGEKEPKSDKSYDVPFVTDKSFILDGHTTSENVLDSIVKYTAEHNNNPVLTKVHSEHAKTKKVDAREAIGLLFESKAGAIPFYNFTNSPNNASEKQKEINRKRNRSLANANYFTAFGSIPAEALVRNWHYAHELKEDKNAKPLLDAIRYYAQGDYNRGLGKDVHANKTRDAANMYLKDKNVARRLNELMVIYPTAFLNK